VQNTILAGLLLTTPSLRDKIIQTVRLRHPVVKQNQGIIFTEFTPIRG